MERNGSMQNGLSRISLPRIDPGNRSIISSNNLSNQQVEQPRRNANKYEHSRKADITQVNHNRGVVRESFNERKIHSGNNKNATSPTIEQLDLYQQKKSENQIWQLESMGYRVTGRLMMNDSVSKYHDYNRGSLREKRPRAGRDRANPLPPIQDINGESENPFTSLKAQIVRPRTYKVGQHRMYPKNVRMPKSVPKGFLNYYNNDDESPLPDAKHLHLIHKKVKLWLSERQSNQMRAVQQNCAMMSQASARRRNPQSEHQTSEEDEGYDGTLTGSNSTEGDMKKKQNELIAQIAAKQRELDQLINERINAEIIEGKKEIKKEIERMKEIERKKERMKEIERKKEIERMKEIERKRSDDKIMKRVVQETKRKQKEEEEETKRKQKEEEEERMKQQWEEEQYDHTALYDNAYQIEGALENGRREKCCYCVRSFAEVRLRTHEQLCKNIIKKRTVLDTVKMRTKGTRIEPFLTNRQPTPPQVKKKHNWSAKHDYIMETMRYAKKVAQIEKKGGNIADVPPPPPTENPDYVQCPHCTRTFNIHAADRHIPFCKNSKARAKPPPQRRR